MRGVLDVAISGKSSTLCHGCVRRAACPHPNSYGLNFSFGINLLFSNVSGLLSVRYFVCVLATELRSDAGL